MTLNNAARRSLPKAATQRGIHLAYSRDWSAELKSTAKARAVKPIREGGPMSTIAMAAAAVSAPLIWLGHTLLSWMHAL